MTHAFFLIMGGFTLHDERRTALRILEPIELESLSKAGKIEWPSISEAEIQDRSKGDYLSKAIVLVQTSWFMTQCIVRGAYRLEVTELEVATLAYAVLTGFTYYLWWKKPLDVRCSIPVYLLKDDKKEHVDLQGTSSVSPIANPDPTAVSPLISSDLNPNHVDSQSSHISEEEIPLIIMSGPAPDSQEPPKSESSHDALIASPEPQFTVMQQFSVFIHRQTQKHGTVLGLAYVFLYPIFSFFHPFNQMSFSESLYYSMPLRVPIFYSPKFTDYETSSDFAIAFCVATIFGAIHCIAWSFHFPSLQERLAWRISAASISGLPILVTVFTLLASILEDHFEGLSRQNTHGYLLEGLIVLYVIARIVLLVLPCIALRELPPTALVEIRWAAFFPHIG
jgi:hypothetical protein